MNLPTPAQFDEPWYLERNPDVAEAVADGIVHSGHHHYMNWGQKEGRPINRRTVSVVIAGRNYGQFLGETIQSALNQTVQPLDVVYSDDFSTDNSVEIARSFPSVKVVTAPSHQGVCAARNRGAAAAHGAFLIFVDADDILPNRYVYWKLEAAGEHRDCFVFSPAQCFGAGSNIYYDTPEWDYASLWTQNYIHTSMMVGRGIFDKVGGWLEGIGTGWDWLLALRLGKVGIGIRDLKGFLLYRQHETSTSRVTDERGVNLWRFQLLGRLSVAQTRICSIVSGRLLGKFDEWFESIIANLDFARERLAAIEPFPKFGKATMPLPNLALWFTGDPSEKGRLLEVINKYQDRFDAIEFRCLPFVNEYESEEQRRWNVSNYLARSYTEISKGDEEVVWFVEDDIFVPPNGYWDMLRALIGGKTPLYAVAGYYRNRHVANALVAHQLQNGKVIDLTAIKEDTHVDLTGTGCLMVFRPFIEPKFTAESHGSAAHDWSFCDRLRTMPTGGHLPDSNRVLLLASVPCRHYVDKDNYV